MKNRKQAIEEQEKKIKEAEKERDDKFLKIKDDLSYSSTESFYNWVKNYINPKITAAKAEIRRLKS